MRCVKLLYLGKLEGKRPVEDQRVGKSKVHSRKGHEYPEGEYWYSSTLSLTSALVGWVVNATPGRFTPENEIRCSLYKGLGGPQGRPGRVRKISSAPEFDTRTVHPVASRKCG